MVCAWTSELSYAFKLPIGHAVILQVLVGHGAKMQLAISFFRQ